MAIYFMEQKIYIVYTGIYISFDPFAIFKKHDTQNIY
jgi:hypothetical protein